uniref:Uncharacterized protein n=1 Tax=Panagrolaimus sp. ES5 TaxID=591445 RepID=A0AC34G614_9BILA
KFAKIFACIGLIVSGLTFLTIFYAPLSLALLIAYIYVLNGLKNQLPSNLLRSQIIYFSIILLNSVLIIAFIALGFKMSDNDYCDPNDYYSSSCVQILFIHTTSYKLRIMFFVSVFLLIILNGFLTFTVVIVHKVRNVIIFEILDAYLPPEEPQQRRNFGDRAFQNIYSSDQNSTDGSPQNDYCNPSQMSTADYININASAPYYKR